MVSAVSDAWTSEVLIHKSFPTLTTQVHSVTKAALIVRRQLHENRKTEGSLDRRLLGVLLRLFCLLPLGDAARSADRRSHEFHNIGRDESLDHALDLDVRAPDHESGGQEFESLRARQA
jgi:hypothetical protein